MSLFVDECSQEIGWLATVKELGDNTYVIDDALLFSQQVHATTCEISADSLQEFGMKLLEEENGVDLWNSVRVWGHSHVNMAVSPSPQDNNQMEVFNSNGTPYFIRIIANKKGELKIDFFDYAKGLTFIDVQWNMFKSEEILELEKQIKALSERSDELLKQEVDELKSDIKKEMSEKVKRFVQTYNYPKNNYNNGYNDYSGYGVKSKYKKLKDVRKVFSQREIEEIGGMPTYVSASGLINDYLKTTMSYHNKFVIWEICVKYVDGLYKKRG